MIRQPCRRSASGIHDVDVGAAVVLCGERDLGSVGRELRPSFQPRVVRDPVSVTAFAGNQPHIAFIGEDDPVLVNVGVTHQVALRLGHTARRQYHSQDCSLQDNLMDHGRYPHLNKTNVIDFQCEATLVR